MTNNKFLYRATVAWLVSLAFILMFPIGVLTAPLFFLINIMIIGFLEAHDEGAKYLPPKEAKLLTSALSHSPLVHKPRSRRTLTCSSGCCNWSI